MGRVWRPRLLDLGRYARPLGALIGERSAGRQGSGRGGCASGRCGRWGVRERIRGGPPDAPARPAARAGRPPAAPGRRDWRGLHGKAGRAAAVYARRRSARARPRGGGLALPTVITYLLSGLRDSENSASKGEERALQQEYPTVLLPRPVPRVHRQARLSAIAAAIGAAAAPAAA